MLGTYPRAINTRIEYKADYLDNAGAIIDRYVGDTRSEVVGHVPPSPYHKRKLYLRVNGGPWGEVGD